MTFATTYTFSSAHWVVRGSLASLPEPEYQGYYPEWGIGGRAPLGVMPACRLENVG